jgi:sugar phosphate isomerase/epimerase
MLPYSRREFAKLALLALPAGSLLPLMNRLQAAESGTAPRGKPNSNVAGVQIGLNVPYSFGNPAMSGDEILASCIELGVSAVELRTQPVEAFLGAPAQLLNAKSAVAKGAAADANAEQLRAWRHSTSVARASQFRQRYENAGVRIEIVKVDGIFKMSDEELDYVFGLAKALGGRAISTEISKNEDDLKRLGAFADKHRLMVGYHGHATTTPEHWEKAFSFARYNGANVDLGHFVAGNNTSPVPFIEKYHDRITHVHVKDRKRQNGPNTPFGEGDTPIVEVLRLLRDRKWSIQATIEFEYKVPAGSTRMAEIARAVKYCRDALA